MSSFQSELGVQFGTSLEAPHVINVDSQVIEKFLTFFFSIGITDSVSSLMLLIKFCITVMGWCDSQWAKSLSTECKLQNIRRL